MGSLFSEHVLLGVTRDLGLGEMELGELQDEYLRSLAGEDGKYIIFYVRVGRNRMIA